MTVLELPATLVTLFTSNRPVWLIQHGFVSRSRLHTGIQLLYGGHSAVYSG